MKIRAYLLATILLLAGTCLQAQDKKSPVKPLWGGYIGLGMGIHNGNLSDHFKNIFMLPITLDMAYKGLVLQINLDGGFGKVRQNMTFDDGTFWLQGDNAFYNVIGANLGYSLVNTDKLRLTPTVGYARNYTSKKWWGSSDINRHEPDMNYLNLAVLTDLKLKKLIDNGPERHAGYTGIRISLGYYLALGDTRPYPDLYNGSTFYFSVGVPVLNTWANRR